MTQRHKFSIKNYAEQGIDLVVEKDKKTAERLPCILCGKIHPLKVHSYNDRLVRKGLLDDNLNNSMNTRILIYSIY